MANAVVWNKHDYVVNMRARINRPTSWMETMDVKYRNVRTIVEGSLTTEPGTQAGTRGTAYGFEDFTIKLDTLTIDQTNIIPIFVDQADLYQQSYVSGMQMADFQGKKISEKLESLVLASHASWTNFGLTDLSNSGADDTAQITVSATNIDDIIRAVKRKIYENNGVEFSIDKGMFFVWRPQDYELLEQFVQANGFNEADIALKNGIPVGMRYMGVEHYLSNDHTANHVFCGVKKMATLGILSGTFGQVKFLEDPADTGGNRSGLGIVARVDHGFDWHGTSSYYKEFFIDLNVA